MVPPAWGVDSFPAGQADLTDAAKMLVHARARLQRGGDTWRIVLCRDSECTPIEDTRARLAPAADRLNDALPSCVVRAVVVDHSLEGWFLADRQALAAYLGCRLSRLRRYPSPETICRPAETMGQVFQRARRTFDKVGDLARLAQRVNVDTIAAGSPTFREFRDALLA